MRVKAQSPSSLIHIESINISLPKLHYLQLQVDQAGNQSPEELT